MLEEINQKTVVGLLVQELIPALDTGFPWEPGAWDVTDTHTTMTHSSTKVATLHMDINLPNSASDTVSGVGKIGSRGINTKDGFMWISEKPDASVLLVVWVSDIRRLTITEVPFTIEEGFKRSVENRTSYLPKCGNFCTGDPFGPSHTLSSGASCTTLTWTCSNLCMNILRYI